MQLTYQPHSYVPASGVRFLTSLLLGAVVTTFIFLFMISLLDGPQRANTQIKEGPTIFILEPPKAAKLIKKQRPEPPKPQPRPKSRPLTNSDPRTDVLPIGSFKPDIQTPTQDFDDLAGVARNAAVPFIRVPPNYPASAARDGIEGYVVIRYDISASGVVENAEVVESKPQRVFNRDALNALRKWKFQPVVIDGIAHKQTNQRVRLDFTLEQ